MKGGDPYTKETAKNIGKTNTGMNGTDLRAVDSDFGGWRCSWPPKRRTRRAEPWIASWRRLSALASAVVQSVEARYFPFASEYVVVFSLVGFKGNLTLRILPFT